MTDESFRCRIKIRDKDLVRNISTAKNKLWIDGKIRDNNVAFAEYCVREYVKIILEDY